MTCQMLWEKEEDLVPNILYLSLCPLNTFQCTTRALFRWSILVESLNQYDGWELGSSHEWRDECFGKIIRLGSLLKQKDKRIAGCRWISTMKYASDGTLDQYEASLVANGTLGHMRLIMRKHSPLWQKWIQLGLFSPWPIWLGITPIWCKKWLSTWKLEGGIYGDSARTWPYWWRE